MRETFKSKSLWGLVLFLATGLVLIFNDKLNGDAVEYLKWVATSFMLSRGLDNVSNINVRRANIEAKAEKEDQ